MDEIRANHELNEAHNYFMETVRSAFMDSYFKEPVMTPWIKVCPGKREEDLSSLTRLRSAFEKDFSYFEQRTIQPEPLINRGYDITIKRFDTINKKVTGYTCKE